MSNIAQEYNIPVSLVSVLNENWRTVLWLSTKVHMACIMLVDGKPHLILVRDRIGDMFDDLHAIIREAERCGMPVVTTGVGRNRVRKLANKEIGLTRFTDICRTQGLTE